MFNKRCLALIISGSLSSVVYAAVDSDPKQSIEVIKVYGEKTERSLKDTTSSVSVIDKDTLDSGQYQSLSSAVSDVPNVVVLTGSVPDIRGVSGNGAATGLNSFSGGAKARVSTLVDGVAEPFVADLTGDTGLWDISQVEVFRGPQSTINGRNSIGGTVFIKTEDPTFDWQGAARVGYRNQDSYLDTAVMLSGPILEDQLAFRISGQLVDGQTYNNGLVYDTSPKTFDQNDLNTQRWRGKLLWRPADIENLSVGYNFSYNKEQGDSGRNYFVGDDPWAYIPLFQRDITTQSNTHTLTFDYAISDSQSIDLLVSYMAYDWGFVSYEPQPVDTQVVLMEDKSYTIDGKYSFGLNNRDFNGFIGLAYFKREQVFDATGGYVYGGDDDSLSNAIYGEITYALADNIWLTAGGRVMRDEQTRNFEMSLGPRQIDEQLDNNKTISLPKLVLQYGLNENTTLGVSARQGYNAGGGALSLAQAVSEYYYYDQETVNAFELTSRSDFDNGNVNLNTNLFYNDYDGYQASNSLRQITNIENAITYGIEVEFTSMLGDDIQLTSGLGWLESEIKKANPNFGDIIGNELNSAPNLTANLGIKYWLNDAFTFAISSHYVGEYFDSIANTSDRVAGDYITSRLNVDYQNDAWRVSAFINNLFDEQALTVNDPPSYFYPHGYAAVIDPRNFGVSVKYNF